MLTTTARRRRHGARTFTRALAALVSTALAVITLVACSPQPDQYCDRLFGRSVAASAPHLVIVEDGTRSRSGLAPDPSLASSIRAVSWARGSVSVLAVNGAGAAPRWLIQGRSLNFDADTAPSDTTKFATAVKRSAGCVQAVLSSATPTRSGTDLGEAFRAAAESVHRPESTTMVADTDGIGTTGAIDLVSAIGASDPKTAAKHAAQGAAFFAGMTVRFIGIAKLGGGVVVPEASAAWLRTFYSAYCAAEGAASCAVPVVDQAVTAGSSTRTKRGPSDPTASLPKTSSWSDGENTVFDTSGVLHFAANSAVIDDTATTGLADVEQCIRTSSGAVHIDGYVNPSSDRAADGRLSRQRAQNTAALLAHDTGQPAKRFIAVGHGGDDPVTTGKTATDAAANRRVLVEVSGGCSR